MQGAESICGEANVEEETLTGFPRLGPRSSVHLDRDPRCQWSLAVCAAALLSRLEHRAHWKVAHASASLDFSVDLSEALPWPPAQAWESGHPAASFSLNLDPSQANFTFTPVGEISGETGGQWSVRLSRLGSPQGTRNALPEPSALDPGNPQNGGWSLSVAGGERPAAFASRVARYIANSFEHAIAALEEGRDHSLGTLPLCDEAEALQQYDALNATATEYAKLPVHSWIAQWAVKQPSSPAVVFNNRSLTYGELESKSDQLAMRFRRMGADRERPVALCIPRSENLPIVLLAALKAGSFFVPLDPTHPVQRLIDILDECKPAAVVATASTSEMFKEYKGENGLRPQLPLVLLDTLAAPAAGEAVAPVPSDPRDKAYTIYTSGTTGKPKGVMVPHGALVNFLSAAQKGPGIRQGERWLAVATISFDMSMMDMFLPLVSGATLVIASTEDATDPVRLAKLLERQNVDCMQATPATWRMLLSSGWRGKPALRMLAGGEALPRDLANALLALSDGNELWNLYGPTETTVYSSFLRVAAGEGPVPIGPPIANTRFFIADTQGRLLPPEIAGELYIGGDGVALGYFERPDLNREKFIANPWTGDNNQRLFRTGDAARLRPDGFFDFFGRLDQQVKLRGFRIELGEIEAVLRTHPAVADAAVVLREDAPGEPWLVAYFVSDSLADSLEHRKLLRAHAAKSLPAYMLPARFVKLDKLPLTGSGKVDKRALQQAPAPQEVAAKVEMEEPVDELEASLLKVFREVLRSQSFGLDDNFFDHGGYSLLAVRLFARIANVLGTDLPITTLFDAPTVRGLAAMMRQGKKLATVVPIRASGEGSPFFLVQSYLLYGLAGSMVPQAHPVFGLREAGTQGRQRVTFEDRVRLCAEAVQRVHPDGPVHLGGWCAAATLTVEIARYLQGMGRTIGLLALFDAEAPGFVPSPPVGDPRIARMRATLRHHLSRLRRSGPREALEYLVERVTQQGLQCVEWFYMEHRGFVVKLRRWTPFLPNSFFYNRWTQITPTESKKPAPLNLRVVLFRATDVVDVPGSDPTMGWSEIARDGVEVIFVPGHHESMFHEPQLGVLRQKFEQVMHKANRRFVSTQTALLERSHRAS